MFLCVLPERRYKHRRFLSSLFTLSPSSKTEIAFSIMCFGYHVLRGWGFEIWGKEGTSPCIFHTKLSISFYGEYVFLWSRKMPCLLEEQWFSAGAILPLLSGIWQCLDTSWLSPLVVEGCYWHLVGKDHRWCCNPQDSHCLLKELSSQRLTCPTLEPDTGYLNYKSFSKLFELG